MRAGPSVDADPRPTDGQADAIRGDAAPQGFGPAGEPGRFGPAGALIAALVALWLALNEISRLSSGFLPEDGSSWSFGDMSGPRIFWHLDRWNDALSPEQLSNWRELLFGYLTLDVLFLVVYAVALLRLTAKSVLRKAQIAAIVSLALVDFVENLGIGWLAFQRFDGDGVFGPLATLVAGVTTLKWLIFLGLAIVGIRAVLKRQYFDRVRRFGRALWIQRFSLLAFLPIAALAVVPATDVFNQLPDVQRQWLDTPTGLWQGLAAAAVHGLVLVPCVFVLGRIRGDYAVRRWRGRGIKWPWYNHDGTARRQHRGLWLIGLITLPVVALVVRLTDAGSISWTRLFVFCAIPVLVLGLSAWQRGKEGTKLAELREIQDSFARDVMNVGDVLTVAAVSLTGLGLVRALTGLVSLDAVDLLESTYFIKPWILLAVGAILAVVPWLLAPWVLRAIALWRKRSAKAAPAPLQWVGNLCTPGVDREGLETGLDAKPRAAMRFALLIASLAVFLLLSASPRWWADRLGVLAAAVLALSALTMLLGVTVAYAQERQPPEVFQTPRCRLRATPIITLMTVAVLLAEWAGKDTDVHQVDAAGVIPPRPTMEQAFDQWLAQPDACTVPFTDQPNFELRPMLLMAAEGGGLRAAFWTASAMEKIGAAGVGCGRNSALFAGGASGGALGLTIAGFTNRPLAAVKAMTGPEALGAAAISLLSGDLLTNATGIRFNSATPYRDPARQGLDRAGLMETSWEREAELEGLRTDFLPQTFDAATAGRGPVTGQLILTSTAVRDGCRALISQVDLSEGSAQAANGERRPECGAGHAGAHSYDLFGAYGRTDASNEDQCLGNISAMTAGLLASRFAYVTPSGVVNGCNGLDPAQLVDGGYTDNTGLGTIVDLAPLWADLVRHHNDMTLAGGSGQLVVPLVVFVENGTGTDYSISSAADTPTGWDLWPSSNAVPEGLVPPITAITARGLRTDPRALLEEAARLGRQSMCSNASAGCANLLANALGAYQVFVVHQSTQPSLSAPLGWVLSTASQSDLSEDMDLQANKGCRQLRNDPACDEGYGTLRDLLDVLEK